ncbi:sororin [Clupea harengus]|uniref:Sororin n=1 Tax=Clupea harengus TaxID=7950 RepID=A0A6P8GU09_CLUHA|nr:sororin [Clupea harengus]
MKPEDGTPPRRRSARLSGPEEKPVARHTFTVRKIVPRKTQTSEVNKENVERLSNVPEKRPKVSTPKPVVSTPKPVVSTPKPVVSTPKPVVSTPKSVISTPKPVVSTPIPVDAPPPRPTILSPILAPQSLSPPPSAPEKDQDEVWSQKVRRSYSRLSGDASFSSPGQQSPGSSVASRRETLFGFEKMQTPKVMRSMCLSATAPQASSSLCGVVSLNLSEAEDSVNHSVEPDYNIPGVVIAKKQSRKKRVQPMKTSELDDLAAQMNAEFAEAEDFMLVVE